MKNLEKLNIEELGAVICEALKKEGLDATLTGGACAEFYSGKEYVTGDLDFVINTIWSEDKKKIGSVMTNLGFQKRGRIYENEKVRYTVEFPPGPLGIGDEYKIRPIELTLKTGKLSLLSSTDCVKDRLAGYFYSNDLQCLEQAVLICKKNNVDRNNIRKWARAENRPEMYQEFEKRIS